MANDINMMLSIRLNEKRVAQVTRHTLNLYPDPKLHFYNCIKLE